MDRRTFIGAVAAGIITAPLAAYAQTATTVRRIGALSLDAPPTPARIQQLYAPLSELGWTVGKNLLIERRNANGRAELLRPLAEELVRLKVEIIVTSGTDAALAAKNATTTIPIIMATVGDPVRAGLVASLARPGGNITGYSIVGPEVDAKRLSLLHELLPGLQRLGVLEDSTNPYHRAVRKEFEQACRALGLQPIIIGVAAAGELENAVAEMARRRAQALFVQRDDLFVDNRVPLVNAALSYALPTIAANKEMLEAGALVSYAHTQEEQNRRWGWICRQNPPRCKAGRSSDRAADKIRAWDQPEDREGARNHRPANAAVAGGRSDSVNGRRERQSECAAGGTVSKATAAVAPEDPPAAGVSPIKRSRCVMRLAESRRRNSAWPVFSAANSCARSVS